MVKPPQAQKIDVHPQRIDVHHHFDKDDVLLFKSMHRLLKEIHQQGERIMATQAELTAQVTKLSDTAVKIGAETSKSLALIVELKDIIKNGPPVSPELQAAVDKLDAQLTVVDDLTPDAPPTPLP